MFQGMAFGVNKRLQLFNVASATGKSSPLAAFEWLGNFLDLPVVVVVVVVVWTFVFSKKNMAATVMTE